MNTKWYINFCVIEMFNDYWNNAPETLYVKNNTYYVLSSYLTSEFVEEIISEDQYNVIISNIISQDVNCGFKCMFEIPEEKLFLMKLKNSDIINFHLELGNIFEGDNLKEGIIIHDEIY